MVSLGFSMHVLCAVAQSPCLVRAVDEQGPVPGATVVLDGRPVGATNNKGEWKWDDGRGNLRIHALGYEEVHWTGGCEAAEIELAMTPSVVTLGGATVVGGMTPLRLKASPIRTAVLSGTSLSATHAQDLVESLDFTTGVRETVGCGVCGTNSVQLNGMQGVYSLVLVDGVPLLGGLASAYALDGLPVSMVQQVEVIQGPASARFGSQAVGGVINVVLAPLHLGDASAAVRMDGHGRLQVSGSGVFGDEVNPWQVGLDGIHFQRRIDDNSDGFTDAPTMERVVATIRHQRSSESRRSRWTAKGYLEERFGGQLNFQEADRGTDNVYGERVDLARTEVTWGSVPEDGRGWTFQGGGAFHQQSSTYGLTNFDAQEMVANLDAFHSGWTWGESHALRGGVSVLWDFYVDDTPASSDMNVWVPAAFAEVSGSKGSLSWIHGLRVEMPGNQDVVIAPRVNVKWSPTSIWDARLNAGRGYRRVHLFTEEHAALDGSRQVLLSEGGLNPESSWNANFSFTRTLGNEHWTGSASIQAFSTLFTDRIYADYDTLPNAILYRNVEGVGWNRGVSGDLWFNGTGGWQFSGGATWLRSELFELGMSSDVADPVEFVPNWTTNVTMGRTGKTWGWNVVAQTVGQMVVPFYDDLRAESSEPYSLIHTSVNRSFLTEKGGRHTLTVGVQNVTDAVQQDPIIGIDDPFDDAFDASRVYGPLEGRRVFVEWTWRLEGR